MVVFPTYADVFRPAHGKRGLLFDAVVVLAGSVVIALSAQISFLLPFSPVPISGQTFAVLLVGALLGSKRGFAAVAAYLVQGAAGLPVFAGGAGGFIVFAGPTGGYLIGFALAAFAVGWLAERGWDRHAPTTVAAMVIGNLCIYTFGVLWLSHLIGFEAAISGGLMPFIVGDIVKIALATLLLPAGWVLLNRTNGEKVA